MYWVPQWLFIFKSHFIFLLNYLTATLVQHLQIWWKIDEWKVIQVNTDTPDKNEKNKIFGYLVLGLINMNYLHLSTEWDSFDQPEYSSCCIKSLSWFEFKMLHKNCQDLSCINVFQCLSTLLAIKSVALSKYVIIFNKISTGMSWMSVIFWVWNKRNVN